MSRVLIVGADTHSGQMVSKALFDDAEVELLGTISQSPKKGPGPAPCGIEGLLDMNVHGQLIVIDCCDTVASRLSNATDLLKAGIPFVSICDGFTAEQIQHYQDFRLKTPCVIDRSIELPRVISSVLGEYMKEAFPDQVQGFMEPSVSRKMHMQRSAEVVIGLKACLQFLDRIRELKEANDARYCDCVTNNAFSAADAFMAHDKGSLELVLDHYGRNCRC